MLIATFYSFKGGVGRSMALMNIAAQLALRGKRVLVVDFDLEAPGLPTFNISNCKTPTKGVVEFIQQYIDTNETPDVRDFVYECRPIGDQGGQLFVMPAGIQDDSYPRRLAAIDWNALYGEHDGFMLFEDLKLQWKHSLEPDYVLIDSRTGHSDVVGICTRQLPNIVALLFFPNEQNIRGIHSISDQIREQNNIGIFNAIDIVYVPSNVPLEDDESKSRESMLHRCRSELGITEFPVTVHHYESPALMHQEVFSLTRDKHPLVNEYKTLTDKIIEHNLEDRDVALGKLKSSYKSILEEVSPVDKDGEWDTCATIARNWSGDGEICFWYSRILRVLRSREESLETLERAIELGYRTFAALFEKAALLKALELRDDALDTLREISQEQSLSMTPIDVIRMLRLALQIGATHALELVSSQKVMSLSVADLVVVVTELDASNGGAAVIEAMINNALVSLPSDANYSDQANLILCLSLVLIAQGRLEGAAEQMLIQNSKHELGIELSFNLAFSFYWLRRFDETKIWAKRVLALADSSSHQKDANFDQCIALACWMVGDTEMARDHLESSRRIAVKAPGRIFSAWAYQRVTSKIFIGHLDTIERLFSGEAVKPDFLHSPI